MAIKDDDLLYVQRPTGLDSGKYKETFGNIKDELLTDLNTNEQNDARYLRIDADAPTQTRVAGEVFFNEDVTRAQGTNSTRLKYDGLNVIASSGNADAFRAGVHGDAADNAVIKADGSAYFAGSTYIGGSNTRNTFELWKSTLTEEQLEQFEAGTFAVPANVSTPGDGEFARQWWYDQQDAETQTLINSGELEYPEHLAAATFTDTFALGDNTNINLNSNGLGEFKGGVNVTGGCLQVLSSSTNTLAAGNTVHIGISNNSVCNPVSAPNTNFFQGVRSDIDANNESLKSLAHYVVGNSSNAQACGAIAGFQVGSQISSGLPANHNVDVKSVVSNVPQYTGTGTGENYNFYAGGSAPNFLKGSTYIGGDTTRNTFELWKSTLTEEQLEQLEAGTFAVPANVSTPGDGEFARQWWYDQQDAETQAAIDSGDLDYPEHLAAATFTDTFDLGDNTDINLSSTGRSLFRKPLTTSNYFAVAVEDQISPNPIANDKTGISLRNNGQILINVRDAASACIGLRRDVDGGFINFKNNSTTEINTLGVSNGVLNFSDQG